MTERDLLYLYDEYEEWGFGCFSSKKLNKMYFTTNDEQDTIAFNCPYCEKDEIEINEEDSDKTIRHQKSLIVRHLLSHAHRYNEYARKYPTIFTAKSKMEVLKVNESDITNEANTFRCDLCEEPFETEKLLVQHLKSKSHQINMIEKKGEIKIVVKSRDTFIKVPTTTPDEDDEIATYETWESFYDNKKEKGQRKDSRKVWYCFICNKKCSKSAIKKYTTKEEMAIHIKTAYHKKWLWINEHPQYSHFWGGPTTSFTSTTLCCEICEWKKPYGTPDEGLKHYTSTEHNERLLAICSKIE